MSVESLKRVLMKIKGAARDMRRGNLDERLNPKAKTEADPLAEPAKDDLEQLAGDEGADEELEAEGEGEASAPEAGGDAAMKEMIRKLLARV